MSPILIYLSQGINFEVVVVDSTPYCYGKRLLSHLKEKVFYIFFYNFICFTVSLTIPIFHTQGIQCSYTLLTATNYVMKNVSKVSFLFFL